MFIDDAKRQWAMKTEIENRDRESLAEPIARPATEGYLLPNNSVPN